MNSFCHCRNASWILAGLLCFAYPFDVFASRAWSFSKNSSRQHWDKTRRSFYGHIDESIYHCHISFLAILAPNSNSSRLISKVLGKSRFQLDAATLTCRHWQAWRESEGIVCWHAKLRIPPKNRPRQEIWLLFPHIFLLTKNANNEAEAVALAMEHQRRGPSDSFCTKVSWVVFHSRCKFANCSMLREHL